MVFNPIRFIFCMLYPRSQNVALAKHVPKMICLIHTAILPMVLADVIHHFQSSNGTGQMPGCGELWLFAGIEYPSFIHFNYSPNDESQVPSGTRGNLDFLVRRSISFISQCAKFVENIVNSLRRKFTAIGCPSSFPIQTFDLISQDNA